LLFNIQQIKSIVKPLALAAFIPVLLAGCQVKPLYSSVSGEPIAVIDISHADTRIEQITRNQLVFLNGGAQAGTAEYRLDLNVTSSAAGVLDAGTDNNFTAGRMTVSGSFTLSRLSDGEVIRKAKRQVTSQYDLPDQEFAKIRALQDAENRAGRELADVIYADISAALRK
jgi:LPS-assembly lipoprotein